MSGLSGDTRGRCKKRPERTKEEAKNEKKEKTRVCPEDRARAAADPYERRVKKRRRPRAHASCRAGLGGV